jgi:hypothetical protein
MLDLCRRRYDAVAVAANVAGVDANGAVPVAAVAGVALICCCDALRLLWRCDTPTTDDERLLLCVVLLLASDLVRGAPADDDDDDVVASGASSALLVESPSSDSALERRFACTLAAAAFAPSLLFVRSLRTAIVSVVVVVVFCD